MTTRTIAARFRGPAGLGNGGYVAGIMAAALGRQPAEVTLRRGWPLEAPVALAEEDGLVRARDEGFVTLDDGTPARRERLVFVDTITWSDPRTNASLTWTVPREEVRVVPVSFQ